MKGIFHLCNHEEVFICAEVRLFGDTMVWGSHTTVNTPSVTLLQVSSINPLVHQVRFEWNLYFDLPLVPHLG